MVMGHLKTRIIRLLYLPARTYSNMQVWLENICSWGIDGFSVLIGDLVDSTGISRSSLTPGTEIPSSEGYRSPQQLWVAGLLGSSQQLPEESNMSDWGGPVPVEDVGQQTDNTMPQPALREMLEAQLQDCIDPFKIIDMFCVDIYQEVLMETISKMYLNHIVFPHV
ncbi:hypothetical protein cypCar_00036112 [Cyprinus carpio]|nr:hypothetical protein cypCar_00036112 [Cyprinus carpio]